MPEPDPSEHLVIAAAAGYREEQLRPFLASLRHYSPTASLGLIVDRLNPEFQQAVRAWFPGCEFFPSPPSPLRDFGRKRKWARSVLKRLVKWSGSRELAMRLLEINYLRYPIFRDLLNSRNPPGAKVLLCDSRDVVFQADPFSGEWPPLWTCEEHRRIEECELNSSWFRRAGGEAAFQQAKHQRIVCSGITGGRVDRMRNYLQQFSEVVEQLAPRIPLTVGDQGIHNYLVRLRPELGFTVFPNGCPLAAHVACTPLAELMIENHQVRLRHGAGVPVILHQYDRHPSLAALVQARWANATPGTSC